MAQYKILNGKYIGPKPKNGGKRPKGEPGDVVEMTEAQAKRYGLRNLERVAGQKKQAQKPDPQLTTNPKNPGTGKGE